MNEDELQKHLRQIDDEVNTQFGIPLQEYHNQHDEFVPYDPKKHNKFGNNVIPFPSPHHKPFDK